MTTFNFIENLVNILEVYNDGYEIMPAEQIAIEDELEKFIKLVIEQDREELLKLFPSHEYPEISKIILTKSIPNIKNG